MVIVTGAGDKAFVAGADINELAVQTPTSGREHALDRPARVRPARDHRQAGDRGDQRLRARRRLRAGDGLHVALRGRDCEARTARDQARPDSWICRHAASAAPGRRGQGAGAAADGQPISAAEAHAHRPREPRGPGRGSDDRGPEARRATRRQAPIAMRYIIDAVNRGAEMPFAEGCRYEATLFGLVASTEDMHEGTAAFLAKRPATFTGQVAMRTIEGSKRATGFPIRHRRVEVQRLRHRSPAGRARSPRCPRPAWRPTTSRSSGCRAPSKSRSPRSTPPKADATTRSSVSAV